VPFSACLAADVEQAKLDHARDLWAVHTVNTSDGDRAIEEIRSLVGERGVTVALDFVGVQPTVDLCSRIVGRASRITIVGLGGGCYTTPETSPPTDARSAFPTGAPALN
jgi:alcohol dehydrogenase, propanol-preferring